MALFVNGTLVSSALVAEELSRLSADRSRRTSDSIGNNEHLTALAERSAIVRVLLVETATSDPRPIPPEDIEREVGKLKELAGCRPAFHDAQLRQTVELNIRVQRLIDDLTALAEPVTHADMMQYYSSNQIEFSSPATYDCAHIICNVNEQRSEEEASAMINAALAELEAGSPFPQVADRYSDCKGFGGRLPTFAAGEMVEEFEAALTRLEPGSRSGIFDSPFGFHIAELYSKTQTRLASFREVRDKILAFLNSERKQSAFEKSVSAIIEKAVILRTPDPEGSAGVR